MPPWIPADAVVCILAFAWGSYLAIPERRSRLRAFARWYLWFATPFGAVLAVVLAVALSRA
jgi:hypothetical protein